MLKNVCYLVLLILVSTTHSCASTNEDPPNPKFLIRLKEALANTECIPMPERIDLATFNRDYVDDWCQAVNSEIKVHQIAE